MLQVVAGERLDSRDTRTRAAAPETPLHLSQSTYAWHIDATLWTAFADRRNR